MGINCEELAIFLDYENQFNSSLNNLSKSSSLGIEKIEKNSLTFKKIPIEFQEYGKTNDNKHH
jgi:hypothetical protein